jgi:hypothetical protein
MKKLVVMALIVACALISCSKSEKWYQLSVDDEYVADFKLAAKQEKTISLDSTQRLTIGFRTDVDFAKNSIDLYGEITKKYGSMVIRLGDSTGSVTTISGGFRPFDPVNNKITVNVQNLTDRDFKVVLYKMKNIKWPN